MQTACRCKNTKSDNDATQYLERERRAALRCVFFGRLKAFFALGCNSQCECEETAPIENIVDRLWIWIVGKVPPIDAKRIGEQEVEACFVQQLPLLRAQVLATEIEGRRHHSGKEDVTDASFELVPEQIDVFEIVVAKKQRHHRDEQALPRHRNGKTNVRDDFSHRNGAVISCPVAFFQASTEVIRLAFWLLSAIF